MNFKFKTQFIYTIKIYLRYLKMLCSPSKEKVYKLTKKFSETFDFQIKFKKFFN